MLATSASARDARFLRASLDADDVIDQVTTSEDVESSKPEPHMIHAAPTTTTLRAADCVFVGDSVWTFKQRRGPACPAYAC